MQIERFDRPAFDVKYPLKDRLANAGDGVANSSAASGVRLSRCHNADAGQPAPGRPV
jgi:hypothetical protein